MIHKTAPHDAAVHESGWVRIGDVEVTALPLVDLSQRVRVDTTPPGSRIESASYPHAFARLTYEDALKVAAREGARLVTMAELEEVRRVGVQLKPYLGTPIAEKDLVHSQRHDSDIWRQLAALGWDGKKPVCGAGKHWLNAAPPGKSRLGGWDKDGAGPGQAWWQPDSVAHNRQHHDDGTTTVLARPARASLAKRVSSAILGGLTWLVGGLRPTAALDQPTLGEALLEEARKDLHVREVGGMNRGPEVDAYNVALGVPLGSSWCASSLTTWLRRACVRLGVPMPIPGSAGAKTVMTQLQKAGRWHDVAELRRNPKLLRPGMILVWDRGGWKGHVGVFAAMRGERGLATVEGNSGSGPFGEGNRVADDMPRTLDDPRLLGAGWVD